jgi:hypothetical protein
LIVAESRAALLWYPDAAPATGAHSLEVSFSNAMPSYGVLTIGIVTGTGEITRFRYQFSPVASIGPLPQNVPADVIPFFATDAPATQLTREGNRLKAELPPALIENLRGQKPIIAFFLEIEGLQGQIIELERVVLIGQRQSAGVESSSDLTLRGTVIGAELEHESVAELLTEKGQTRTERLTREGQYVFENVHRNTLISIRLRQHGRYYFSDLGRWFEATVSRTDLVIRTGRRFINPEHRNPDPKSSLLQQSGDRELSGRFVPHSRQRWAGYPTVPQEYESITFSNNDGHVDADRFGDNPDGCLRLAFVGSSFSVALQVTVGEKYNTLLEEDLGIKLGRCVEALSMGRDNGDLASLYPRLKHVMSFFHPEVLFIENSSVAMSQLSPELLRSNYGYDYESSPLDHFIYGQRGKLQFVPWDPNYGVFATKATLEPLRQGVPLGVEPMVSFANMTADVRDAYKLAVDIIHQYKSEFAGTPIVLFTGFDQILCHGFCEGEIALPNGNKARYGALQFLENNRQICAEADVLCVDPDLPKGYNDKPETYLSWINDAHMNPAGHQWLATEFSAKIARLIRQGTLAVPRR